MKYLFSLIFLLFFSFDTSAVVKVSLGSMNCTMSPNLHQPQVGLTFRSQADAKEHLTGLVATYATATCSGLAFTAYSYAANGIYGGKYTYRFGRKSAGLSFYGIDGCTYSECEDIAKNECENEGKELDSYEYFSGGSGDFNKSCKDLPPDEPLDNAEECTDLANNQCYSHGGFSGNLSFDDGATSGSLSCDFTCNDGTTGDKFGSNANTPDGFCESNNPNDLADCDVPSGEPDCVGCGAFTPDETSDLPYNPDGTSGTDGTGTDGITSTQGDVLINEIKKLKNENAKQEIKGSNKVADAIDSINPNQKLDELITAVKANSPLDNPDQPNDELFDDSGLLNAITTLNNDNNSNTHTQIGAANSNNLSLIESVENNTGLIVDALNDFGGSTNIGTSTAPSNGLTGFYTSAYPLGVEGMFDGKTEEFKTTEFYLFLDQFKPQFSGSAPNMSFCMNFGSYMNLGCFEFVLDPRIWPALKIFILITAGFTCRKILFGG
jgi:hypothetical protein